MPLYEDFEGYRSQANADNNRLAGGNTKDDWQRWGKSFLGGPIGIYEGVTGKNVLSDQLLNMVGDTPAYSEMYDKRVFDSMGPNDWAMFNKMNAGERLDFVTRRLAKIAGTYGKADAAKASADKNAQDEAAFQQWKMQKMRDLDAFSKKMGMSVEELLQSGDAGIQAATNEGRSSASAAAFGAGLTGGGISGMNTQRAVADAQTRYQMGRQQMGLQANTELLNQMGQMGREAEDMRRYDQGMNIQMQNTQEAARQRNYAEGLGRQQSMFGLAGGVIGGIYGGPQGAALGYNLGSGVGGMTYAPYSAKAPTYAPQRTSYGLGGGSTNYGGAQ